MSSMPKIAVSKLAVSKVAVRAVYAGALGLALTQPAFADTGALVARFAAPVALETVSVSGSSGVTVGGASLRGSATAKEGDVIRLAGSADYATVKYADGSVLELKGAGAVTLLQIRDDGRRVTLASGSLAAKIEGVAIEIQTPHDVSLVLQSAKATATVAPGDAVTFVRTSGEYARVYKGGASQDLGATPYVLSLRSGPAPKAPSAAPAAPARSAQPVKTVAPPAQPAKTTAREEAAKTVPVWDATAQGTESTEEGFFRLARDFASTSEVGGRRLGYVPVWPRGELKLGAFRVLPYLREGVEYVSNFYRAHATGDGGHGDRANDSAWTHVNQLGAKTDAAFMGGRLRLLGSIDTTWNVRYDDSTDDNGTPSISGDDDVKKADTFEMNSELGASYSFESGMYVRGGLAYERRADPIDVEPTAEFQRTNRRTYLTVGFNKDIIFDSKMRFEVGTAMRDVIGREEELSDVDRTEANYYVKASYPFWKETTRIFGRARYRQDERESQAINDGYTWGFDAGLEGTIPLTEGERRGLRGQVSLGFDSSLYDDDTYTAGSSDVIADENRRNTSVAVNGLIQYTHSRKTSFDLRLLRTNQFGFHGNYQIVNRVDLSMNYVFNPSLAGRIGTFWEYDEPSGRRQAQPVGSGDITGEYPNVTRGGIGAGVRYKVNDWLDWDVQYDYENRNNRLTGFTNHRASMGFTLYLNALKPRAEAQR